MSIYNNGKIYKLVNSFGTTYIGSTTQTLAQRKAKHMSYYKEDLKSRLEKQIRSLKVFIEDPENVDIVLLELVNCNSKMELHQRERHYIETLECVNKVIPGRTMKEYYFDNHDEILSTAKIHCSKYRLNNIEKIREQKKIYREANKETINEKKKETVLCVCGAEVTSVHLNRHKKTAKHVKLMEEKELIE